MKINQIKRALITYIIAEELIMYEDIKGNFSQQEEKRYREKVKKFREYSKKTWNKDEYQYFNELMKEKKNLLKINCSILGEKPNGELEYENKSVLLPAKYIEDTLGYTIKAEYIPKLKKLLIKSNFDGALIINLDPDDKLENIIITNIVFISNIRREN